MLDLFKEWINRIISLGIIFTILNLVVPNSKLKKYIYSLMGIVTLLVIGTPAINLIKEATIESNVKKILLDMTSVETMNTNYTTISNYEDINKNNVKETFKENIAKDIKEKLKDKVGDVDVKVEITLTYNIDKIEITTNSNTDYDIKSFISQEYDVKKDKINVNTGGKKWTT